MAPPLKPPGTFVEQRAPSAYTYTLTGRRWGMASIDPGGREVVLSSRSSRDAWTFDPRVRVTSVEGRLTCVPGASQALVDDAGAPWGTLRVEPERVVVTDAEGRPRLEVARLAGAPRDGSTVLAGAWEVRVLDADGFPEVARPSFTP